MRQVIGIIAVLAVAAGCGGKSGINGSAQSRNNALGANPLADGGNALYYEWTGAAEVFNESGPVDGYKLSFGFGFDRQSDGSYQVGGLQCPVTTWDALPELSGLTLRKTECGDAAVNQKEGAFIVRLAYTSGTVTFPTATTAKFESEYRVFYSGVYTYTVRWKLSGVKATKPTNDPLQPGDGTPDGRSPPPDTTPPPETCCGPALGLPSFACPDGTVGGNTGNCIVDKPANTCHWEIRECP